MTSPTNPLAGRNFQDETGVPVVPGQKVGEGGEGVVYLVEGDPGSVVKIWHPGRTPPDAEVKIHYLANNPVTPELGANWRITWPQHQVFENGVIAGYTMPRLDYTLPWTPIINYYNPRAAREIEEIQGRELRIDDRVRIASNVALGYKAVHDAGYVIGDINEKNLEANRQNDVALMDCDSYGFTDPATGDTFSNEMGRPDFQAPEAQGDYANRTQNHDCFGLAVVIFQLLTRYHPYTVTNQPDYAMFGQRISAWLFAPASGGSVTAPDPFNEAWDALTDRQKELFLRCFDKTYEGQPRPTPEEWVEALREMPKAPETAPTPSRPTPVPTPPRPTPAPGQPPGSSNFFKEHKLLTLLLGIGAFIVLMVVVVGLGDDENPQASVLVPTPSALVPVVEPTVVPTFTLVPAATPTPTPAPSPTPTATPVPTVTPTLIPTPTFTPVPTATPIPTPLPTPTYTPTPTATPRPTPIPTPRPTLTPTPIPSPRPTLTPTPTPRPTATLRPTPIPLKSYSDQSEKWGYTISVPSGWTVNRSGKEAEIQARDGQVVVQIFVKGYPDELSPFRFAEEHQASIIKKYAYASEYFDIFPMEERPKHGHARLRIPWRLQQDKDSCVMDMVDMVFRSRHFPTRPYGYVVRVGICNDHLREFLQVRERIFDSFAESEPPKKTR